jgi:hypothetical protein
MNEPSDVTGSKYRLSVTKSCNMLLLPRGDLAEYTAV